MLHSMKVIILVEKKGKEVAWLGFELTTSMLEVRSANYYTMVNILPLRSKLLKSLQNEAIFPLITKNVLIYASELFNQSY